MAQMSQPQWISQPLYAWAIMIHAYPIIWIRGLSDTVSFVGYMVGMSEKPRSVLDNRFLDSGDTVLGSGFWCSRRNEYGSQ
jgi:hypothetical protein